MLHKLSLALLFAVLTCGQIASTQITHSGKCPEVKLMEEFHWPDFEGVWYEYARYSDSLEGVEVCVNSNFTTNNETIAIQFVGVNASNQIDTLEVNGRILGPGLFVVTIKKTGTTQTDKILGTDYKSWAVIYSCDNVGAKHVEFVWILIRDRNLNEEHLGKAMAVLKQNGVSKEPLKNTMQDGCPSGIQLENTKTNLLGSF